MKTTNHESQEAVRGNTLLNVFSSLGYFLTTILIGILFTPYLVNKLGLINYGIVSLVLTLTGYLSIVILSFNSAVGRYLAVAIEQGDTAKTKQIFATSFFGGVIGAAVLLAASIPVIIYSADIVVIPAGMEKETRLLFILLAIGFAIGIVKAAFEVATYSLNRFDLRNSLAVFEALFRVMFVVILFGFYSPANVYVGISNLFTAVATLGLAILIWRRIMPGHSISIKCFDLKLLKTFLQFGGWVTVSTVGTVLFLSIDLVLVNHFFGTKAAGEYAIVMQWPSVLRNFAVTIAGVFGPRLVYLFARDDTAGLINYAKNTVKILGLAMTLPVGLIAGFSDQILLLWVGHSNPIMSTLLIVMVIHLGLNLGYLPLHSISTATTKVRLPAIVQVIGGILNLVMAITFCTSFQLGMLGVALSGTIILTLRNLLFTPWYAAHILRQNRLTFMKEAMPIAAATVMLTFVARLVAANMGTCSLSSMLSSMVGITIGYSITVYVVFLNHAEQQMVNELFLRFTAGVRRLHVGTNAKKV